MRLAKDDLLQYSRRKQGTNVQQGTNVPMSQPLNPSPVHPVNSSSGNDPDEASQLKKYLAKEFEIKDLGRLKYFLGIEVARSPTGIFISQRKYILDLLKEIGMLGCKPTNTPIEASQKLMAGVGRKVDKERYQRLVGRLIYLTHMRPDVTYAVSIVSQFMHDPRTSHMEVVYRILRYFKSSPRKGLLFARNGYLKIDGHLKIEAYTDADWAGSIDDRRSTMGYYKFIGGNLVIWRSKKQTIVSRSIAEAEYRAMASGVCEVLWLRGIMHELGLMQKNPILLYCDSKVAINIAHNLVQHDRTKHIEVARHFIKEKLLNVDICIPFVRFEDQLADVLTKGLSSRVFESIISKMSMSNIYASS
ncbi:uncharacterized mitochondrial protein AtMg00810-like [Tripterygium wilfordii]|uniref:uncharacterized mitochondrial protein AtMg00810-like n=1 Tax=Tripterygium wilfordii TaxID=458696 RepID=UPI0018F8145E|nr:uncharacterized mitochondrial protein AtMg00810-like [Tripterygium wilfordii]